MTIQKQVSKWDKAIAETEARKMGKRAADRTWEAIERMEASALFSYSYRRFLYSEIAKRF